MENAAVILQQLDYWMKKEGVGVLIDGVKYIYNTYKGWTTQQFRWLSERQFRNSMDLLRSHSLVDVVQHKSKQWNQTNYYSLNYDALAEFLKEEMARSIETVELPNKADRGDENGQIDLPKNEHSYKETKNTSQKSTAKQSESENSPKSTFAAASLKNELKEEKEQKQKSSHKQSSTASNSENKAKSEQNKQNLGEETNNSQIDYIVNKSWKDLIPLLDSAGVPTNRTIKDLLKLYSSEKVENAISLVKARKREQHIPNPSGYFVAALQGGWGSKNLVSQEKDGDCQEIDKGAVFRHWYDLARELGYCSGTEVREGEQS